MVMTKPWIEKSGCGGKEVKEDTLLLKGDCLELMKDIPDKSIDLILADLPYGTTRCSWDIVIPFEPLWAQYKRIIKDRAAIVLFSSQPFTTDLINSNRKMFRYELIWEKQYGSDFLNANRKPLRSHENLCIFYKKLPVYNPQKTDGTPYIAKSNAKASAVYDKFKSGILTDCLDGKRYLRTVMKFNTANNGCRVHPSQKPVELLAYLIKTYTNKGGLVLDNCMGSGSTGVACVSTGRRFIGMELDEGYFETAARRIGEARGER